MKDNSQLLDALLFEAAEATKQPPPPRGGIPKQWPPFWIRFPAKCLALPFVLIDFWMQKLACKIIRPPFKRVGKCKRRGNCCHYVLIAHSDKWIGRLFYLWYTQFLGFYKRVSEPQTYEGKKMHVMGCRHLKKDGSCGDYHLRPLICRQWPVIEHFGYPKVLKGCGYASDPPYEDEVEDKLSDDRLKILQ